MVREQRTRLEHAFRYVLLTAAVGAVVVVGRTLSRSNDVAPGADAEAPDADVTDATADDGEALDPCAPVTFIPGPDAPGLESCGSLVRLACGLPADVGPTVNVGPWAGRCIFRYRDCAKMCKGRAFLTCHAFGDSCVDGSVPETGPVTIDCSMCKGNVAGRRPEGLQPRRATGASTAMGEFFAGLAHLEAASVHAFRRLRRELADLGAPRELTQAAARAMRDEARHARVTERLAKRHGARCRAPRVRSWVPSRSVEALAIENAVEGCVRETFGALYAHWQAAHAADPAVAATMTRIAIDETHHAALAWAIADWLEPRLDTEARARVAQRRAEAIDALREETRHDPAPDVVRSAGAPSAAAQRQLLSGLDGALWRA